MEELWKAVMSSNEPDRAELTYAAEHESGIFWVTIEGYVPDQEALTTVVGGAAGAYAGVVEQGHGGDRMEAELVNMNGEYAGSFYIERAWVEEYNAGEISGTELAARVMGTFESP